MYWSHFEPPVSLRMVEQAGFGVLEAEGIEDAGEMPLWVIARRAD